MSASSVEIGTSLAAAFARPRRRHRDQARAGGEIERRATGHQRRVIEQVAGQGLAARPRERPERRRLLGAGLLGPLPELDRLVGLEERDLGNERNRRQPGVGVDELEEHAPIVSAGRAPDRSAVPK
jgi:hypothetical protein